FPAVPKKTIIRELSRYRDKGTQDPPMMVKRLRKLSMVGLRTISLGGKRKNSFNGLKALLMAKTMGIAINAAIMARMTKINRSPPKERDTLRFVKENFIIGHPPLG
ncbi:MAG: hypothetical protein GX227_11200, partial [Clostridiaceae bacterium]|nr:hypothetical protein [Clostridiaceae bacterium]